MEPAFMLYRRPRKGSRVLGIPLVWRRWLLGAHILRDLPKRPGGSVGWGKDVQEAAYAIEQNMSQGMCVGVSGGDDDVLNRVRNV